MEETLWSGLTDEEISDLVDLYLNGDKAKELDDDADCLGDPECFNLPAGKHSSACNEWWWSRGDLKELTGGKSSGTTVTYSKHEHKQVAYALTDGTVIHCSSHHYRNLEDEPDLACYLDGIWDPSTVAFHLGWKDFGLPYLPFEKVRIIAEELLAAARNGKKVEIGCIGGHGRTGTFLAVLDVLTQPEGEADAKATIKRIRSSYCGRAIETAEQEWYVEVWAADRNGVEAPAKPVKVKPLPPVKKAKPAAKKTTKKAAPKRKTTHRKAGTSRYNNSSQKGKR